MKGKLFIKLDSGGGGVGRIHLSHIRLTIVTLHKLSLACRVPQLIARLNIMRMLVISAIEFAAIVNFQQSMAVASVPWSVLEVRTHQPQRVWDDIRWKSAIVICPYPFRNCIHKRLIINLYSHHIYLIVKLDKYGLLSILERKVDDWNNNIRRMHKQNADLRSRLRCNIAIGPSKMFLSFHGPGNTVRCVSALASVRVCVCVFPVVWDDRYRCSTIVVALIARFDSMHLFR